MKKGLIATIVGSAVILLVVAAPIALAKVVTGDNTHIGPDETVNDDLYITGQTIVIEGTVNGDVYAAGKTVTVKGTINGDLIAVGQTVLVEGTVKQHVRVAGQTVQLLSATVGSGLSAAGQTVTMDSATSIDGGVQVAGQSVQLDGKVARGVMAGGETVAINGSVGRDIHAAVTTLSFGGKATVDGRVMYRSGNDARIASGAHIQGGTSRQAPPVRSRRDDQSGRIVFGLAWLLASFVTGALIIRLLPGPVAAAASTATRKPLQAVGLGLVALIVALPAVVLLGITIVGLPLALMLLVAFFVSLYLSHLVAALALGQWLVKMGAMHQSPYFALIIGLVVLAIVGLVPLLGGVVGFAALLLGLGTIVMAKSHYLETTRSSDKS